MISDIHTLPSESNELQQATLHFLVGWQEIQQGVIRPGGELIIEYDTDRLPACRQWSEGALCWANEVTVCFHPGGQQYCCSTQQELRGGEMGPVVGYESKPVSFTVPLDATQIEMWFHSFQPFLGSCDAWDSRFGQNYWYDVVRD